MADNSGEVLDTLRRIEALLSNSPHTLTAAASYAEADPIDLKPGDIAQVKPSTCKAWGGCLFRVTDVRQNEVRGFFLRPHRSGWREAWAKYTPGQLVRLGCLLWPEGRMGAASESAAAPLVQKIAKRA